jgi:hypothetical protein
MMDEIISRDYEKNEANAIKQPQQDYRRNPCSFSMNMRQLPCFHIPLRSQK